MWTIIFLLILANVFVAILADAYVSEQQAVEAEEAMGIGKKSASEILTQGFWAWMDKTQAITDISKRAASIATLGASDKALDLANAAAKMSADAAQSAAAMSARASGIDKLAGLTGIGGNMFGDKDGDGGLDKSEMMAQGMSAKKPTQCLPNMTSTRMRNSPRAKSTAHVGGETRINGVELFP